MNLRSQPDFLTLLTFKIQATFASSVCVCMYVCGCAYVLPPQGFSCLEWYQRHAWMYRSTMLCWGHYCDAFTSFLCLPISFIFYHISPSKTKLRHTVNWRENDIWWMTPHSDEWNDIWLQQDSKASPISPEVNTQPFSQTGLT